MDTTVIQPAPGQSVISTNDHDHGRHGEYGRHDQSLDEAILREQAAGFRTAAQDFGTVVRDIKDSRFDLAQNLGLGFAATARASCHTDEKICDGLAVVSSQIAAVAKDNALGFKDLTALGYQVEGRSLLEAAKNAAAIELQNEKLAAAATVQAERVAAAAALQAEKIASAAAAQLAACCCEMKELVREDGDKTRALLNAQETDRLRAQLARCESQNAAYFTRNIPPIVP